MLNGFLSKAKSVVKNEMDNLFRPRETINIKYYAETLNWGDKINVDIIEFASGKKASNCLLAKRKHILGIGSILITATENSIIWGSGFLSEHQTVKSKPYKVCSVRGPHSRAMLLAQGIDCPEIYGDPALLLPRLYSPSKIEKKFKLGIVPHYLHKNHPSVLLAANNEALCLT